MNNASVQGTTTVLGRVMIAAIFLLSAIGNKIPQFGSVAESMAAQGVPLPHFMLAGAIVFLVTGSVSVAIGYHGRIGAALLFVFLALATYFFHDFWTFEDVQAREQQTIQFMKNAALMGTMLMLIANGPGPMSLDAWKAEPKAG